MNDPSAAVSAPAFTALVDLAAARTGGAALGASDEFFAPCANLLQPGRGVFVADRYTERGKWMDGWESRRRRGPGHDWCVVRLGLPGAIHGVDVDTNHFLGNFPEHASLDACVAPAGAGLAALARARWTELMPRTRLAGGSRNLFPVVDRRRYTHVRLNIYPDGGVARLRVHGVVAPDWKALRRRREPLDLAAIEHGGVVLIANDTFFSPKDNLIMPGPSAGMHDGWETRRKRGPGHDWVIVRLGAPGTVARVEVDTSHFKGNYPDACSLDGLLLEAAGQVPDEFLASRSLPWRELLAPAPLRADTRHVFSAELRALGPLSHVRLNIHPDGGVARLRVFGRPA